MGQKLGMGAPPPFLGGELGPNLAQCSLDHGPPLCQVPSRSIQPFGHNGHGPKIGERGSAPFLGRGAGSPSNTMWPGMRPTCLPSFVLIRPTVWPQCTNVTDTQVRTDRQTTDRWHRANRFTNGRPKTVRPIPSDRCPVCPVLSVTLLYCGQTVGRIKMKLGMRVGLGPGHTVLDGDPALPWKGARQPPPHLKFTGVGFACVHIIRGPCLLWPNGWMDQDETWHGGRPPPSPNCVKWGPSSPSPKGHIPPNFRLCLLWPNGWMDQDAAWYGLRR